MPELIPAEPGPGMATAKQRWDISDLFTEFGIIEMEQVRADAARILKLDYLPDLRELTQEDADELIGELRRALAAKRVGER